MQIMGKGQKERGNSFESPQYNYHIIPIYGKSIRISCPNEYSTYCIISCVLTTRFALKSCGISHLAKMPIIRYHKSTERVIPMI